jgi:hypothetical protein
MEGGLHPMGHYPLLIGVRVVVVAQLVIGHIVIRILFILPFFEFVFCLLPVLMVFRHLQRRVLFQLLLDPLFQVSGGHLQQLHQLNLLWRELLE